jgi:hypothetical protein
MVDAVALHTETQSSREDRVVEMVQYFLQQSSCVGNTMYKGVL